MSKDAKDYINNVLAERRSEFGDKAVCPFAAPELEANKLMIVTVATAFPVVATSLAIGSSGWKVKHPHVCTLLLFLCTAKVLGGTLEFTDVHTN